MQLYKSDLLFMIANIFCIKLYFIAFDTIPNFCLCIVFSKYFLIWWSWILILLVVIGKFDFNIPALWNKHVDYLWWSVWCTCEWYNIHIACIFFCVPFLMKIAMRSNTSFFYSTKQLEESWCGKSVSDIYRYIPPCSNL